MASEASVAAGATWYQAPQRKPLVTRIKKATVPALLVAITLGLVTLAVLAPVLAPADPQH